MECDLLIVSDPNNGLPKENALIRVFSGDRRAMQEATEMQIPVVAICNTNSLLEDVDVAIPANNVGMKAIATIYYLLARAIQLNRGQLSAEQDVAPLSSFETEVPEPEEEE
jgi:ribosomal protein S2